jgi:hypothetical protein
MSRTRPPDRQQSFQVKIVHVLSNGNHQELLMTYSLGDDGRVAALFCADFKAGTDNHNLIMDMCVVASKLLQHGYTAQQAFGSLSKEPTSMLGSMLREAAQLDKEHGFDDQ